MAHLWRLHKQFVIRRHFLSGKTLVYHSGSGQTHLLVDAFEWVFNYLYDNHDVFFVDNEIEKKLSYTVDINEILSHLRTLWLVEAVEDLA